MKRNFTYKNKEPNIQTKTESKARKYTISYDSNSGIKTLSKYKYVFAAKKILEKKIILFLKTKNIF